MNRFQNIQAVTFDVGGTLIDPRPSVGHVYAEVAARHGLKNLSVEMLNRRFLAVWRAQPDLVQTKAAWAEIVDQVFLGLVERPPSQTFFSELYQRFSEPGAWHIYEDVLPALKTLGARGLRLGVISNWDDRLRPLLSRLGLANHFQTIVVSCEAGSAKPAPAIFQKAAGQLGMEGSVILHVGDSLEMDIQAAQSAGWSAVQIIRKGVGVGEWQVTSLLDLSALIGSGGH